MTKILSAAAALVAVLALAPASFGQVCADCDPGGGGGGTGNSAPTAAFSSTPAAPQTQEFVTFTNSSSDSDGSIASSSWSFGDGGTSTAASPQHMYADGGTYTVTLTVTDNDGAQNSVSHDVTIANRAPSADFLAPAVGYPGEPVDFTGQASDPESHLASFSWSFGDNGMADVPNPSHTYANPGTYEVSLVVYDNQGAASNVVKKSIRINAAPTAHINAMGDQVAGELTQFTSQNADTDGNIVSSCWDFGDGRHACGGGNPGITYAQPGDYTATLTVTDNDGSTGSDTVVVHVKPAPVTGGGDTGNGGGDAGNGGGTSGTDTTGGQQQGQPQSQQSGGGGTVVPVVTPAKDTSAPVITVPASLRAKKKAGKVVVAITSNEAVNVVANLTGKVKGSAKASVNGKGAIVIKLSSKAKKALKAAKVVKLTLKLVATDAAGNKTTKTVKVMLV